MSLIYGIRYLKIRSNSDRLKGLSPEERLEGLKPEDLKKLKQILDKLILN